MYNLLASFFLFIFLLFSSFDLYANQIYLSGVGKGQTKDAAVTQAKVSAWKNYIGKLDGAKLDNVMANEAEILNNLDSIISDINIVDEKCDGPTSCTVKIKATINENVLDSKLRQISQANSGGSNKTGSKNASEDIAFLVVARLADAQTSFDTKTTKRAEASISSSKSSAEVDTNSGDVSKSGETKSSNLSAKTVTGGSNETKRDNIKYVPYPSISDLQGRIGEALTNNKISTIPWEELVNNCGVMDNSKFSNDYASSETGEIPGPVRNEIYKKLRECQLNKIIIASIEIDSYRPDPNTGLVLASGNINIQIYDFSGRFAKSVGSANRALSGRGEMKPDAARNALAAAAKVASDVIVNQLNLK
jgi:hypothetical protein